MEPDIANQTRPSMWESPRILNALLLAGIQLRLIVFAILGPFNPDGPGHLEHILFVKQHWSLPPGGLGHETWQPPLYYFVTGALALISENPKFLQLFSLAASIATLLAARKLIYSTRLLRT